MESSHKKKKKSSSNRSTPNNDNRSVDGGSRASSGKSVTASQLSSTSFTDVGMKNDNSVNVSRGYDLRAHLAQILTISDEEDELSSDEYSLESFDGNDLEREVDAELKRLVGNGPVDDLPPTPKPTDSNNCQSLLPITEEHDDLDSEEENEIMKEIRDEIKNNVRQEMKSELELYQIQMKKLEKQEKITDGEPVDNESEAGDAGKDVNADMDNIDPKLKEAILKMKKLDKILSKRVRREKEVKRDRILLERRIRRELEDLHKEKDSEYKEVRANEQKYLALELPSRHNEDTDSIAQEATHKLFSLGFEHNFVEPNKHIETFQSNAPNDTCKNVPKSDCIEITDLTPRSIKRVTEAWAVPCSTGAGVTVPDEFTGEEVFATQLNEEEYPGLHKNGQGLSDRSRSRKSKSTRTTSRQESEDGESRGDSNSVASGSVDSKGRHKKRGKDFIKRNRELAADAANTIAMTDEEKKRLDELLLDVDGIPEITVDMELDDSNPFQIAIQPGEGFHPDNDELRSLTSIDSRLKEIMPPDDYESIASSALSYAPKNKLFTHTGVKHTLDWESRGEKALFQNAEQREMNERLFSIEQELTRIHNPEEYELDTPRLKEGELQDLIEQCVTSLSMTNMSRLTLNTESRTSMADTESIMSHDVDTENENTSRTLSPSSARRELLEHPPKLAPDVLQKLLAEAYHPLSKELSALQEVENEDDDSTPVPAEVWRLIAMEGDPSSDSDSDSDSKDPETHTNNTESHTNHSNGLNIDSGGRVSMNDHSGNLVNHSNSRNGFRTLSRNSSSLTTVSDTMRESMESKPLKLPEIDPSGTLVTQGLSMNNQRSNNQQRTGSSASSKTPVNMSWNSVSEPWTDNSRVDSSLDIVSLDGDVMTPRPPSEKRESSAGSIKSRTVTPSMRTSIT